MAFRRGFKTEANKLVEVIRIDLDLSLWGPLDPRILADDLGIPVLALTALREQIPGPVRHFSGNGRSAFSAVTVFDGPRRMIVYNDSHSDGRQSNSLSHELAHALLFHEPSAPLDSLGCRHWDETVEDEANFLGGALLIPDEAAVQIVRRGLTENEATELFGVSKKMLRYRLNITGAQQRVQRAKNYSRLRKRGVRR